MSFLDFAARTFPVLPSSVREKRAFLGARGESSAKYSARAKSPLRTAAHIPIEYMSGEHGVGRLLIGLPKPQMSFRNADSPFPSFPEKPLRATL